MRALPRSIVLLLAACLWACDQDYPNPFADPNVTEEPPPGSDLLLTSNVYGTQAGAPRELYAIADDGSGLTRLTFCNRSGGSCANEEATVGRSATRVAVRRIPGDANGDGVLTAADGASAVFVDLATGLEGTLLAADRRVSGLDWSPVDELLVYSAVGAGGLEDLFRMDSNGANNAPLTDTASISERRPRIDPSGSIAAFERIETGATGRIWIFVNARTLTPVTLGGVAGDALPGTPYRVGSDADPDFSPDGRSLVFRRLTGPGSAGRGAWDLLTVRVEGTELATIASGPAYRGAPDWGPDGIVFEEVDTGGQPSLVLVAPDGSSRRTLATAAAGLSLSAPRWLP